MLEDCPTSVGENLLVDPIRPFLLQYLLDEGVESWLVKDKKLCYLLLAVEGSLRDSLLFQELGEAYRGVRTVGEVSVYSVVRVPPATEERE